MKEWADLSGLLSTIGLVVAVLVNANASHFDVDSAVRKTVQTAQRLRSAQGVRSNYPKTGATM